MVFSIHGVFYFTVGDAPSLSTPLSNLTVVSPEVATFTAKVTPGEPRACITCYKDDKQLENGDKFR